MLSKEEVFKKLESDGTELAQEITEIIKNKKEKWNDKNSDYAVAIALAISTIDAIRAAEKSLPGQPHKDGFLGLIVDLVEDNCGEKK